MVKFFKNQKGVTMMEVLVTVAILAIVVAPCLSAFVMAQRGNVKAAETAQVYTAAANLMEELKGMPEIADVQDRLKDTDSNPNDNLQVTYYVDGTYVEVWVYAGEGENKELGAEESAPEGYILKGVIAP